MVHNLFFLFTLFLSIFIFNACSNTPNPKAVAIHEQAVEIFTSSACDDYEAVDSILMLVDRAQKIDPKYVAILEIKIGALFRIKDGKETLKVVNKLCKSHPKNLFYKTQKAFYLELEGKTREAKRLMHIIDQEYQSLINKNKTDFNLKLNYISFLDIKKDSIAMQKEIGNLKKMKWDENQTFILEHINEQINKSSYLEQYWQGKIDCHELYKFIDS